MDSEDWAKCGCWLGIFIFNLIVGGICASYLIWVFFGKDIFFVWDILIGLVGAEFIVPVAIVVWILKALSVI